jgi:YD repeat-containing protein
VAILVSHSSTTTHDPYPVPPVSTELWGVRTTNAYVAALQDNTSVQVWASNGEQQTITLNAGEFKEVTVGLETSEGQGSAIHLVADKPIAAVQHADSDGVETTAFLNATSFATHYIIPVATQYVAMVCNAPSTVIELQGESGNLIDSAFCGSVGSSPGKAYFGSTTDGSNIAAGSKIVASQPIYLIYEAAAANDEHNLLGYTFLILADVAYPGSGEGETTHTTDPFIAIATPTAGNEANIQTLEFSLNGTDWFSASLVDGVYQHDFGNLTEDLYTLHTRITQLGGASTVTTIDFEVVDTLVQLIYHYDALGRVICVEDATNGDRDYDYDDAGNRSQVTIGTCTE